MFKINKSNAMTAIAIACSIALPNSLLAADNSSIEEIIVTTKGSKSLEDTLPTVHVFSQEDIELAQVADLTALLDSISGVSARDSGGRGSATSVFIRGTANSQIIVLIDGVRVGSATLGAAALNSYPVEAIERIEIVKGPLSGIYGADAAGGVIQLFTKKGGEGIGSANVTVGSNSLVDYGVGFNVGNERHSFNISAQAEDTDGIDSTTITSGGNGDKDSYEETSFSFGGKVTLSESTVANLSVLATDSTVEFDNTFGDDTGFETETKTLSSALNISTKVNDNLRWNTTLGINEDEAITEAFFSDVTSERTSLGTELEFGFGSNSTMTIGADYYEEDIETASEFPVNDRDNKGVFGLLQTSAGDFDVVASVRYDDNSSYGSDTNGSIALSYDFNSATRAVLSYGTAFIAPSFNFLYFPFFGNPDLLPEDSESFELSLTGQNKFINWRVSAYKNDIENLFSFDPSTFLAANIGEAELKGIEFEIDTEIAEWNIGAYLDLLNAEDKDTGNELDGRANKTLAITASRDFGALDLRFDFKFEDGRYDLRGTELDSYGLFDISARYAINERLSVLANIENLFDKDYAVSLISPTDRYNTKGRQSKLSLKYDF